MTSLELSSRFSYVALCGLLFRAGSRHEKNEEAGDDIQARGGEQYLNIVDHGL